MRQIKLEEGKLLDQNGNLLQAGYNTSLVKEYRRSSIKKSKLRIKEKDYYYVGNSKIGLGLSIADYSYLGIVTISIVDFENKTHKTKRVISLFPMGKTNLSQTSKIGNVSVRNRKLDIRFLNDGKKRQLVCKLKNFDKGQIFSCDVLLYNEPSESIVTAIPFEKKTQFYYNQKINCLKASGKVSVGTKTYDFDSEPTFGMFSWSRGVLPYSTTYNWSTASGLTKDGRTVGFNLGYGLGDTSYATENMLFLNGKSCKTEQVTFHISKDDDGKNDYSAPWTFSSSDKRVNLTFVPSAEGVTNINLLILKVLSRKVYGKFNGTITFNDEVVEIKNLPGFVEKKTKRD